MRERTQLVTTRTVLIEIGNFLAKRAYRHAAIQLLRALETDPTVEIVPLSESLYAEAFALYQQRLDKDWGITDCISFVVMRSRSITAALTTDEHFQQSGFQALLRG